MISKLPRNIEVQNVLFSITDTPYNSQYIYKITQIYNIFSMNPINPRDGEQIKHTHRRGLFHFLQTIFGKQLMKERLRIEQQKRCSRKQNKIKQVK